MSSEELKGEGETGERERGAGTATGAGTKTGGSMFGSGFGFSFGSFSPPSYSYGIGTPLSASLAQPLSQSSSEPSSTLPPPPSSYRQNGNGIPYRGNTNLTLVIHATEQSVSEGVHGGGGGAGGSSGLFSWARLDDEILQPMFGDGNNHYNTTTTNTKHPVKINIRCNHQ